NIWLAAADGKVDVVEHLLKHGGPSGAPLSPNIKDDSGYTPLHAAAAYSHIPLIDLLVLGYNADINIVDDDGDTPLHVCETLEAAKRLKELGADVDMKN
ncbi:ankyrin repeat-containing domain protein, partial [Powellomyces hirtus]